VISAGRPPPATVARSSASPRRSRDVSRQLVKTHDRLCLEDLAVANLLGNGQLACAISDAAWTELARQRGY
jgi:transposase